MNKKGFVKWLKFFALLILIAFVYLIFKRYVLVFLRDILPVTYTEAIENMIIFIVIMILNYFFVNFSSVILRGYLETKGEKRNVKLLISVYRYFVWFFVIFITLSLLFRQIGSLITSIGLIGFGITFALQKPILNFVGWVTIVFSRTYKIGDVITINNISGSVYDVKIMYTSLAELNAHGDPTGKSVSMPNEFVLTTPVINSSKGTNSVWDEIIIPLTYKSDWKKASKITLELVKEVVNKHSKKIADKNYNNKLQPITRLDVTEKGIILKIRYFIDFSISNDVKTELNQRLLERFNKDKHLALGKTESIDINRM